MHQSHEPNYHQPPRVPKAKLRPKSQLTDELTRAQLLPLHPLITTKVVLRTPPIVELFKSVKRVVTLRETGCSFSAPSGVGKSCALNMLVTMLHMQMPNLYVVQHHTHNNAVPSIRAFFKNFLVSIGHHDTKGETADLRQRVVNTLVDQGQMSGLNLVVLLLDEAQAMANADFRFLKDVYNDLQKEGVQLITILMGQAPDFDGVIKELRLDGKLDLISRFAIRNRPFRALNSLEDLVELMRGIDAEIYPDDSDWTWTEFFLPRAFAAGFQLENEAPLFLEALKAASPHANSGLFSFPARQVFIAIRAFLVDNADLDAPNPEFPETRWIDAARYALLEEAMQMMSNPPHQSGVDL
jgi:AAA domain